MTAAITRYSLDDEDFIYFNIGEIIDYFGVKAQVGDRYFVIDVELCRPTHGINCHTVDVLLEGMEERIHEDIGEFYDSVFDSITVEAKDDLRCLIEAWAAKHIDLSQYWVSVGKSRECALTAEDLA
jgi:hypothetical protein